MANLSTNSKHIITTRSGHEIHLEEPQLVINAMEDVINDSENGKGLKGSIDYRGKKVTGVFTCP